MPRQRPSLDRASEQRGALLALSRALAGGREGGILSDGLDLMLNATGTPCGCVYAVGGEVMELVGHRGLPPAARQHLERLTLEPPWFIAQTAAARRTHVVERDLPSEELPGGGTAARSLSTVLSSADWNAAVAFPLIVGRQVDAVAVIAAPTIDLFGEDTMTFLETASNMLALGLTRARVDAEMRDRSGEIKPAQMAALGMLAIGFADDLRSPLDAVALLLEDQRALVRSTPEHGARASMTELIEEAASTLGRAQEVVTRLLAAVRESDPEPLDLADLARSAVALVSSPFKSRGVKLEVNIQNGLRLFGRREELTQLLMGLLLNGAAACESAKDRGKVPCVRMNVGLDGARVAVSVGDSGPGVPPNLRSRIFEPFFTTKTGSLGLGLTLAKHAVVAHRGHIEVAASELGGAMFRILLPAAPGASAEENASARPESGRPPLPMKSAKPLSTPAGAPRAARTGETARPRLLWIDDDDPFLRSVRRTLADFDVSIVNTVEKARAELDNRQLAVPVRIFCDIGMPSVSGTDLHAGVARTRPDLARLFVFVTGGVITPEVADYVIASGCPTLLKPIDRGEILAILERPPSASETPPPSAPTLRETTRPSGARAKTARPLREGQKATDRPRLRNSETMRAGKSKETVKMPSVKKPIH